MIENISLFRRVDHVPLLLLKNDVIYESALRGSKLILMDELSRYAHEIEWQKEVVFVYCTGRRCWVTAELAQTEDTPARKLRQRIIECLNSGKKVLKTEQHIDEGLSIACRSRIQKGAPRLHEVLQEAPCQ